MLASDERCKASPVQGIEAALGAAFAWHPPGLHGFPEALEVMAARDSRARIIRQGDGRCLD